MKAIVIGISASGPKANILYIRLESSFYVPNGVMQEDVL